MDALLGAAGAGDIGRHFPDSDSQYKDISSMILLARVKDLLSEKGLKVVNIDTVIVAQEPRMAPHMENMAANVAAALEISSSQVNIKATTTEGLGFTGAGEGIAAYAIAMIE
jgi:2-C-methyl-D-erythritol 2,4-cyclodiphosphate synthase